MHFVCIIPVRFSRPALLPSLLCWCILVTVAILARPSPQYVLLYQLTRFWNGDSDWRTFILRNNDTNHCTYWGLCIWVVVWTGMFQSYPCNILGFLRQFGGDVVGKNYLKRIGPKAFESVKACYMWVQMASSPFNYSMCLTDQLLFPHPVTWQTFSWRPSPLRPFWMSIQPRICEYVVHRFAVQFLQQTAIPPTTPPPPPPPSPLRSCRTLVTGFVFPQRWLFCAFPFSQFTLRGISHVIGGGGGGFHVKRSGMFVGNFCFDRPKRY